MVLMMALLTGILAGCGGGTADSDKQGTAETGTETAAGTAMGRFVEEEITLPDEELHVLDIAKMADGSLEMMTVKYAPDTEIAYVRWKSTDKGTTWEQGEPLPEELMESNVYISAYSMSPEGEAALITFNMQNQSMLYVIDKEGQVTELEVSLPEMDFGAGAAFAVGEDVSGEDVSEEEVTMQRIIEIETEATTEVEAITEAATEASESTDVEAEDLTQQPVPEKVAISAIAGSAVAGETIIGGTATEGEDGEMVMEENSFEVADMSNAISDIKITDDGKIIVTDYAGGVYLINRTDGTIERTYQDKQAMSFFVADKIVGVISYEGTIQLYDIATGEPVTDQILTDEMAKVDLQITSSMSTPVLVTGGDEENTIYFCNSNGLFRRVIGGTAIEEVIDGNMTSIGSPGFGLQDMEFFSEEELLIVMQTMEGQSKIIRYTYSKDTPARPSKEITVYSLKDNLEVRQAISMFQQNNPDYYIAFEIGMTGEDSVTAADALRTLNTDIMAGNGPDVLLLDGMPVDSYIEKGLLADITDLLAEVKVKDDVFGNITNVYEKEDGYYVLPTRVRVPLIQGDSGSVASATDLQAFTEQIEKLREENPEQERIIESRDAAALARTLYSIYSAVLQKEDGSLNEEELLRYYTYLQRLQATDRTVETNEMMMNGDYIEDVVWSVMEMILGELEVAIGSLGSVTNYNMLISSHGQIEDAAVGLMELSGEKVFIPTGLVGINSKSEKIEDAQTFVSYLLGAEAQQIDQDGGFPINRTAFANIIKGAESGQEAGMSIVVSGDGKEAMLEVEWATKEELATLQQMIESLDTAALTDSVISEAVLEQAVECAKGNITAEEATSAVIQKVQIYLAEQG